MTGTPLSSILLVLLAAFIGSFGAVFLKLGAAHLNRGVRGILNWQLAAGIGLFLGSSIPGVIALKNGELSVLYPMVSLSYVFAMLWSRILFGEPITRGKVSALTLILGGILCIGVGGVAAEPPEIVTHNKPANFTSRIEPIPAPLFEKMRTSTWHAGCPVPPENLRQLTLTYWNFKEQRETGTLIVNKTVAKEVTQIFHDLFTHGFLIEKMTPVEDYNGSDDASMAANNTSAFNCRDVTGQPGKFSNHSWGLAIDINPLTNPYVKGDKVLPPEGARYLDRTKAFPGSILTSSFIVRKFTGAGWTWGGTWSDRKDYQHFEKPMPH